MSESVDKKGEKREVRRSKLIQQLREEEVQFFLNSILEPTVHIPACGWRWHAR